LAGQAVRVLAREPRRFGDQVLYLAPAPDQPFRRLTDIIVREFPDYPPYGGAFRESSRISRSPMVLRSRRSPLPRRRSPRVSRFDPRLTKLADGRSSAGGVVDGRGAVRAGA